jgi:hypothetical protein
VAVLFDYLVIFISSSWDDCLMESMRPGGIGRLGDLLHAASIICLVMTHISPPPAVVHLSSNVTSRLISLSFGMTTNAHKPF